MTTKMERKLSKEQMRCVDAFRDAATSAESDEDLGLAILELYLKLARMQREAKFDDAHRADIDAETKDRLQDLTELAPEHSLFEGFSRRLASDPLAAMRYLSDHISARSADQSKRAKRPRRRDVFSQRIDELVADDPDIPAKTVEARLLEIEGIILLDGELRHVETAETMRLSNLPDRVSEAKKRRKKNSDQPG